MLKFRAQKSDGTILLGFGLSEENIIRLKNDQSVFFSLDIMGFEGTEVMIFYGETDEKMKEIVEVYIHPEKGS